MAILKIVLEPLAVFAASSEIYKKIMENGLFENNEIMIKITVKEF